MKAGFRVIAGVRLRQPEHTAGFSLVEIVITLLLISIMAGLSVPGWLRFERTRRLRAANQIALDALRGAQSEAIRTKEKWEVDFRVESDRVEVAIHPVEATNFDSFSWQRLPQNVVISPKPNTTFYYRSQQESYRMRFNEEGHVQGNLGRIVFTTPTSDQYQCIFVSTLLGTMRVTSGESCTE